MRRCNADERGRFIGRFAVWAFACKREFQTDLIQAFIVLRYRELDFFSSDTLRLTFASQKLVFTETSFWLLFVSSHNHFACKVIAVQANIALQC